MKIRRGNNNRNPSLVVGITSEMKQTMGLEHGSHVTWSLNEKGRWEFVKLDIKEAKKPNKGVKK